MIELLKEIAAWQKKTFPGQKSESVLSHLREEVSELCVEHFQGNPLSDKAEEAADVFLLLVAYSHLEGFDLMEAVEAKLGKNKKRKWAEPDERGVVKHLASPEDSI